MIEFSISKESEALRPEVTYLLNTWGKHQQVKVSFNGGTDNGITIGPSNESKIKISRSFNYASPPPLDNAALIKGHNGEPDFLGTAFYMLNSIQEHNDNDKDGLNRFKYANSYQFRLKNSKENIVQHCFDEITKSIGRTPLREKARFFLSHDIDMINGAILEDGFYVLKQGRIDLFFRMLFNVAIGRPDWLNMDKIMQIESEYDCKSVFFWIVNKGKINKREKNADYSLTSNAIQRQIKSIENNGFENGIHKSISNESFTQEFAKFGRHPFSNRYHYLKFSLPDAYHDIEAAKLKLDASLGFAEEIGFRNSYGLPFNPFNTTSRKPFTFVEVPLHIMDRTYFQYKKYSVSDAGTDIIDFFEKNRYNSVISILWHNNFFTNYKFKGYLDLYKKILGYMKENDFSTISQKEIVEKYSIV